jgi:3-deoxy-D-manno-octulosonate 8-phosphate phosphatase (KDO 8-P phosphatase)
MAPEQFKRIKLLLLDVDGVLTDGGILYTDGGEEIKIFHVKDGLGIRLLQDAGIGVGIVTARGSAALHRRCTELGITQIYDNVRDKGAVFDQIRNATGVSAEATAFVGDDLPDLPLMKRVGLPIAVADAHEAVIQQAAWVSMSKGGTGAVREICEHILKSQGLWENALKRFDG